MEILKVTKKSDYSLVINRLIKGQIGVILSDTIYGLSCVVNNNKAIDKIYEIKNRPRKKPFIILISDFSMLKKYFIVSNEQLNFFKIQWSKNKSQAITFILRPKKILIKYLKINPKDGQAIRLPKNDFLITIIKSLKVPLVSTSCNLSGEKPLNNFKKIIIFFRKKYYLHQPDFVVLRADTKPKRKPSKILDIRDIYNIKKIR